MCFHTRNIQVQSILSRETGMLTQRDLLKAVLAYPIPVYSKKRSFCDPQSAWRPIYQCRAIDAVCTFIYTYIVGVGGWPKRGRNRGEKTHARKVRLSRPQLTYHRSARCRSPLVWTGRIHRRQSTPGDTPGKGCWLSLPLLLLGRQSAQ